MENGDTGSKSAEAHFEEKLLKVRDRMKTAFGKEEAERRHQTVSICNIFSDFQKS